MEFVDEITNTMPQKDDPRSAVNRNLLAYIIPFDKGTMYSRAFWKIFQVELTFLVNRISHI